MNRIYQGRVSAVEVLKPGTKSEWEPLPDWRRALWEHHELFQDAVNYYTLGLAALAEGVSRDTAPGAAAWAWRQQVRENWLDGRRKALRYDGPHRRLAPWLGVAPDITNEGDAFDASARAIIGSHASAPAQRSAVLLQLLEEVDASDLNVLANNRLPWLCTPRGQLSATPRHVVMQQETARIRQTQAIHAATPDTLAACAAALEPGRFVTQMPTDFFTGESARAEALKQFQSAAKKSPGLSRHEPSFLAHLEALGERLRAPQLGRKPSGIYPFALVLHLWPTAAAWESFKAATKNLATKEAADASAIASDPFAEARVDDEPLFAYFTNRALRREPDNADRAVWFEFDLAAFVEAIKSPHRFFQDTQSRAAEARRLREQLHFIDPSAEWLKNVPISAPAKKPTKKASGADESDEGESGPAFTFAGDSRIALLRDLLTNPAKLGGLGDAGDGEYTVQERTLRGWNQIRDAWRKRASRGPVSAAELWEDVKEVQGDHRDDFGSATLFETLTQPEHHSIWRDPPADAQRHAEDPLRAWKDYREQCFELNDKERPIRFTPAHAEKSPRYFILPKTGRFGTKHLRAQPTDPKLRFTGGTVIQTAAGLEPVLVRFEYSAPRLRRDELRSPGETDLAAAHWLQPMMAALDVREPDAQDFANCRVTLQPASLENHQLTFPVEVDTSMLQKSIGGARWSRQFNVHPDGDTFYDASLRWPHEKQPAKPPVPWWEAIDSFTVLATDLGQRDAGAFALLDVRANADFAGKPARFVGQTGDGPAQKTWRAALAASGILRLPGEDRLEWRKASRPEEVRGEQGYAWREELFGERGRRATADETDECAALLRAFGIVETDLLPEDWREALSYPEQNDKLLVAARRAQSRLARLHRWAWLLADISNPARLKQARDEIAAPPRRAGSAPDPQQLQLAEAEKSGDADGLRAAVIGQLHATTSRLPALLVQIANRVLPLRGRVWAWEPHPDEEARSTGCWLLHPQSCPSRKPLLRGQRGLSLERIEQIEELRRRFQSLNQSLRRQPGAEAPKRRDERIPDPCPAVLEKLDRLKTQRVNQTAHLILAEALGLRLRAPASDKAVLRATRDIHGQYKKRRAPADFIVIEDLARYRATQGRAPRENSRLMKWCHRAIRDKVRELCAPFGLPVVETVAAWSSRFCARTGVPGFRAAEVTAGFSRSGSWGWIAAKKTADGTLAEEAQRVLSLDAELCAAQRDLDTAWTANGRAGACPRRTLLAPLAGGPIFIPLVDRVSAPEHPKLQPAVAQSDINAAINLALRAVADPRLWPIHPRLRTQRDGKGSLLAKEKRKYGAKKAPALTPRGETELSAEAGRVPNFFFDRSATISWGQASLTDPIAAEPAQVVLGAAMWKTVREAQWLRCEELNRVRLAQWRAKTQPGAGALADDIPM